MTNGFSAITNGILHTLIRTAFMWLVKFPLKYERQNFSPPFFFLTTHDKFEKYLIFLNTEISNPF